MNLEQLRYPIGRFQLPETITDKILQEAITILEIFPEHFRNTVHVLDENTLNTPYREEGWTVRQVIHHVADSHHNSYTRFKWALTEDNPVIKAYDEKAWANLNDYTSSPIAWSLDHLEAVHHRLVYLLKTFTEAQWNRTLRHPDTGAEMNLKELALMYSWHSMHHFAHIKNVLKG
jgi:hypothetical protein